MACCLHVVDSQQYPDLENHPEDPETNWIGVYYNLVSAPETATHVNTQVELDIFNKSGEKYFSADGTGKRKKAASSSSTVSAKLLFD